MAMSSDKVVCPYDPVHVVEKHKLVWHLGRCAKTYKGGQTTQMHCPLDYSHVVQAGQLENHVRNCPQLALAAPLFNVATDSSAITGNLSLPKPLPNIKDLVTADWDVDERAPAAPSDYAYGASDLTSEISWTTAATSSVWAHSGCGRGRGRGATAPHVGGPGAVPGRPGGVGRNVSAQDSDEPKPGDMVPGGYRIREIYYPPDYGGLRGRFEERGTV